MKSKKKLVIVESPAKAKTIGKFLGSGFEVIASQGHVRDLPKSQMGVDVEHEFEPKYITIRGRSDLIKAIRKQAKDASRVYLATDPDREGEAIAWHLAQMLGMEATQPCRVSFNEITQKVVKEAIQHPRPVDQALVDAQQARRVVDRLVGYEISPLLWANVRKRLSAGRVQSAAARMICVREDEIESFVPREYFTLDIEGMAQKVKLPIRLLMDKRSATREFDSLAEAEAVANALNNGELEIKEVRQGRRQQTAPAPFTTSSLQQEAARKLNFTTKRTMVVAQQLYEGVEINKTTVGLVTYIRTDGVRLSDEAVADVRAHIGVTYGPDYVPQLANVYKGRKSAQDAHEAIRPTEISFTPESVKANLTADQFKLYRLIYARFVACQMAPAEFDTLAADFVPKGGKDTEKLALRYSGERLSFAGYRAAYIENNEDEDPEVANAAKWPHLVQGERVAVTQAAVRRHETTPPARFTEAMLVRTMENLGIGRPSTYAPTISTVLERGYVVREGRSLLPTELGRIVNTLMCNHFPRIADADFTAQMEDELDSIEEGNQAYTEVVSRFYGPFAKELASAQATMQKVELVDEVSEVACEKCGRMMVYKQGRYGRFLACPGFPECRNTKNITKSLDVPCPKCGGEVQIRRTKTGRLFYGCSQYPNCDFRSWDRPVQEKCPTCGGSMAAKRLKGAWVARCLDAACDGQVELPEAGED